MSDKFPDSPIQACALLITNIIQKVVKPLHLQYLAQTEVLNVLRRSDPDLAKTIDDVLSAALASPILQARMNQEYPVALEKALQQVFGSSQDAEILKQMRKDLGLVN